MGVFPWGLSPYICPLSAYWDVCSPQVKAGSSLGKKKIRTWKPTKPWQALYWDFHQLSFHDVLRHALEACYEIEPWNITIKPISIILKLCHTKSTQKKVNQLTQVCFHLSKRLLCLVFLFDKAADGVCRYSTTTQWQRDARAHHRSRTSLLVCIYRSFHTIKQLMETYAPICTSKILKQSPIDSRGRLKSMSMLRRLNSKHDSLTHLYIESTIRPLWHSWCLP